MPVMSTRGSISVRFVNHLVPRLPATVNYRVATSPGDSGTSYTTTSVTTSGGVYTIPSQGSYEAPGRYTWICPVGVTSVSVMAVGGGGGGGTWAGSYGGANGGGGGGYAYMYNYPVTPGASYTIQVGCGGETAERYGSQYWDTEDDGTLYDKSGSGGAGGIASWFGNRTICRGGGGTNGQGASWNGSVYTTTAYAWGGYWTLGAGLSGSGLAGGFSDQPVNGASGPPSFCGGGAAGTSSTKGGFDTTGSGSYYSGASYSGGSTGGGGGGGGGYSASGSSQTVVARTAGSSWSPFMNSYAVWPNSLSIVESYSLSTTFTAASAGSYNFQISADDNFSLYVDGTFIGSTTNFTVDNPTPIAVTLTTGSHTLRFDVSNSVNATPAGFALVIKNPSSTIVWDTRTNYVGATVLPVRRTGGGGGGIGIYGITATTPGSGAVGSLATNSTDATGGGGGSGGQSGYSGENVASQSGTATPSNGGKYGGGGGGGKTYSGRGASGGHGIVRLVFSSGAAYPSTNLSDKFTYTPVVMPTPRTYILSQQSIFATCGTYTWVCPPGVTSVSVMCIGAGGNGGNNSGRTATGGGGGGYAYIYNYTVTPGASYTVKVGCGGGDGAIDSGAGSLAKVTTIPDYNALPGDSYFNTMNTVRGGGGENGYDSGTNLGTSAASGKGGGYYFDGALSGLGRRGGDPTNASWPSGVSGGGGGAGGIYDGDYNTFPSSGQGAPGGAGGTISTSPPVAVSSGGSGGGGMGIYGIGSVGAAATYFPASGGYYGGGGGGSGGEPGTAFSGTQGAIQGGSGGKYGGGGAGNHYYNGYSTVYAGFGADGVVRIIWGSGRAYPSTSTSDVYTTVSF